MLTEWHLDPVYISENWTDEMLFLMIDKLVERKEKIHQTMTGNVSKQNTPVESLGAASHGMVKVIKRSK